MRQLLTLAVAFLAWGTADAQNFRSTDERVTLKAEQSREALSVYWTGEKFPRWNRPCSISIKRGPSSGSTSFCFDRGEVFGWRMTVKANRIGDLIDDVVPHEVNHTIFATMFRRPIPRWLDEGAAVYVESESEHLRQRKRLADNIAAGEFVPFRELMSWDDYPKDGRKLFAIYSEGFAIVSYLVDQKGGRAKFVRFVGDVRTDGGRSSRAALRAHYGLTPESLEKEWFAFWRSRTSERCQHHACRAPHSGVFDPAVVLTDGAGNGVGIRSPAFGFTRPVARRPACCVVIFSGSWCEPCQRQERVEFPKLRAAGYSVGGTGSVFEYRKDDEAGARAWNVRAFPTAIVIHSGREIGRKSGYLTADELAAMLGSCRPLGAGRPKPTTTTNPARADPIVTIPAQSRCNCSAEWRKMQARLDALEARPVPTPVDLSPVQSAIYNLDQRLVAIENQPKPTPFDPTPIENRLQALETKPTPEPFDPTTIVLPVRIETSEGIVIREKEYRLKRDASGRWVFEPIVLRFDEKILRGE